jgi:hypothetical protein
MFVSWFVTVYDTAPGLSASLLPSCRLTAQSPQPTPTDHRASLSACLLARGHCAQQRTRWAWCCAESWETERRILGSDDIMLTTGIKSMRRPSGNSYLFVSPWGILRLQSVYVVIESWSVRICTCIDKGTMGKWGG